MKSYALFTHVVNSRDRDKNTPHVGVLERIGTTTVAPPTTYHGFRIGFGPQSIPHQSSIAPHFNRKLISPVVPLLSYEQVTMDNFEQNNEVSTSYNNNNLKHNFNCKNFYEYVEVDCLDKKYADQKNFRKIEEDQLQQQHLGTPFLVKDILNINQPPNYYERNDIWKNERDRKTYEYTPDLYHQPQSYCSQEYFNQMYSNIPVHSNVDPYWCQEAYHDVKVEDYYSYNPYCHNLHHQSYEHYQEPVPHHLDIEVPPKEDLAAREPVQLHPGLSVDQKKSDRVVEEVQNMPFVNADAFGKLSLSPRKGLSK